MGIIRGTKGNDSLRGTSGADEIYGLAGNDTINPGFGADKIDGGAGKDTIVFTGVSSASTSAVGSIAGGSGSDTIDLRAITDFDITMQNNVVSVKIGEQRFTTSGIETIRFGAANDFITPDIYYSGDFIALRAGGGNDYLSGSGNYGFYGEGGDDKIFIVGAGSATRGVVDGGDGADELGLGSGFTLDLAAGIATVRDAKYTVSGFETISAYRDSVVLGSESRDVISVSDLFDQSDGQVRFAGKGGDDTLSGSEGMDDLDGGAGADVLLGGRGADTLTGGADLDRFVYRTGDSIITDTDLIVDFQDGVDRIDLTQSDAISFASGINPFTFIGKKAFSGAAGELRFLFAGQVTLIEGDTNGDKRADLLIQLDGRHDLKAASFILAPESASPAAEVVSSPSAAHDDLLGHLIALV